MQNSMIQLSFTNRDSLSNIMSQSAIPVSEVSKVQFRNLCDYVEKYDDITLQITTELLMNLVNTNTLTLNSFSSTLNETGLVKSVINNLRNIDGSTKSLYIRTRNLVSQLVAVVFDIYSLKNNTIYKHLAFMTMIDSLIEPELNYSYSELMDFFNIKNSSFISVMVKTCTYFMTESIINENDVLEEYRKDIA